MGTLVQTPLVTELLTAAEAAAVLGVGVTTIHRMIADGRLTAVGKLPGLRGAYLFDADQVAALRKSRSS